jgi:hypothetical protein
VDGAWSVLAVVQSGPHFTSLHFPPEDAFSLQDTSFSASFFSNNLPSSGCLYRTHLLGFFLKKKKDVSYLQGFFLHKSLAPKGPKKQIKLNSCYRICKKRKCNSIKLELQRR